MKRLLIGLIMLGMTLGSLCIPSLGAANQDGRRYDEAVAALTDFDILSGEVDQSAVLTREKAAMWIYNLMGMDAVYEGSVFADVPVGGRYADAILTLNGYGLISGYPDGKFHPAEAVEYQQFVKILIDLLGYGKNAAVYGGYPDGYGRIASDLKLDDDVYPAYDRGLTIGEAAQIFYNALQTDVQGMVKEGEDSLRLYQDKGTTLLSQYKNIYKTKGRITKNDVTGLTEPDGTGMGKVKIGEVIYNEGKTDAARLLGQTVTLFYHEDDGDATLMHLEPKNGVIEVTVNDKDILRESCSRTEIVYQEERTNGSTVQTSLEISAAADIIYNGKAAPDIEAAKLYPYCGEVRLLDSDGDNVYDVVFVTDYAVFFISHTNEYEQMIYNQFEGGRFTASLQLDPSGVTKITDRFGEALEFSDISANDMVFVAASITGKNPYYGIVVCDETMRGAPSAISDDTITIGGKDYEISDACSDAADIGALPALKLNSEYDFYLDANGRIGGYVLFYAGAQYGYLQKVHYDSMNNAADVKMFCRDGTWKLFKVSKQVILNGTPVKPEIFATSVATNQFARYILSGDSRITEIYMASLLTDEDVNFDTYVKNDVFRKAELNNTYSNNKYYANNSSFSNAYFMESNATVFLIPTAQSAADDEFACTNSSYFTSENRYTLTVYDMDEYRFSEIFVMSYDSSSSSYLETSLGYNDYCLMVDKVTAGSANGAEVSGVSGLTKGQKWSYISSESGTFDGLKRGDIIRTKYDDSGKLNRYVVVHRTGTETLVSNVTDVNNAVYIFGNILKVEYTKRRILLNEGKDRVVIVPQSIYVTIYDKQKDAIRSGALQDLETGDYIVLRMRSSVPYEIFIIR